ncbi:MAG: amidohydrolase [Gemmobacter sp.]
MTPAELAELTDWRRALHRVPELSGAEAETARAFVAMVEPTGPDLVVTGLGGHGVAVVYRGAAAGPTVMIRSELDALPIVETGTAPWVSQRPGVAHLCGHEGHLTILAGVARALGRKRPARGRVILLAQPAEEDGSGAAAVIADPRFAQVTPDWAFALHNMPGAVLGECWLQPGPMNCASLGLKIVLGGRTAHAAEPHAAVSSGPAIACLIPGLASLGQGGDLTPDFRLVTVTHVRMGEPAFGIAPGSGEVWATLRALTDDGLTGLLAEAEAMARAEAAAGGLALTLSHHDHFAACANDPQATEHLATAIRALGMPLSQGTLPMRASEDFGRFGAVAKAAMVCLGAGAGHPRLHNPDYDFPDALIAPGVAIFDQVIRDLLG